MENLTLEEKISQFNEFFTIKHPISVNAIQQSDDFVLPDEKALSEHMPYAFRIASDIANIEAKSLRSLRNLSDHAAELAEFLNHQSHKIDLIMSYVLKQEDDPEYQFQGVAFGGSGVTIQSPNEFTIGATCELKLFLDTEASAIFCYGEVIKCEQKETAADNNDNEYITSFIYTAIREQDQELLVRASLHLQSQQLRKTSK